MNIYRESNVYDEEDIETEDVWYYFDANGFAVTGKQKIGGKTYIFARMVRCCNICDVTDI